MPPDSETLDPERHDDCLPYCWCRYTDNTPSTTYRFKPGDEPLRFPPAEEKEEAA